MCEIRTRVVVALSDQIDNEKIGGMNERSKRDEEKAPSLLFTVVRMYNDLDTAHLVNFKVYNCSAM